MIREYKDKSNNIFTELHFDDYVIVLRDYFFIKIYQNSLSMVSFNTTSSREAVNFFSIPMDESDYTDFGDCFETFKDGIWSVYEKPSSNDHPEILNNGLKGKAWREFVKPIYKKYGTLLVQMPAKHFPKIVEFLKQYQSDITHEEAVRIFTTKERDKKIEEIIKK